VGYKGAQILEKNHLMPTPCKNCRLAKPPRRCLVDVTSGHCSECLDRGLNSCDLVVPLAKFQRALDAHQKLEAELEATEAAIAQFRAKQLRLLKQLSQSDRNFQALVDREEASIAELEVLEQERESSEKAVREPPPTDSSSALPGSRVAISSSQSSHGIESWGSFDLGDFVDPSLVAEAGASQFSWGPGALDYAGGTDLPRPALPPSSSA
jgi:uncharacterized protein YdcH (DUF465 family)